MRVIKNILITQIKMDRWAIQHRTLSLIEYLKDGGKIPPIHVTQENGHFRICDGRHRVTAYKLLGREKIRAKFFAKS